MSMAHYCLYRIALMIPTLFGVITLSFLIIQFVPGGPVDRYVSLIKQNPAAGETFAPQGSQQFLQYQAVSTTQIEKIKKQYGFDKPLYDRYIDTLIQYATFDFGDSYYQQGTVLSIIGSKLPVSASLGLWSFLLVYLIGLPLGIKKALWAGSLFDTRSTVLLLIMYSIPGFLLAVVLLSLFGGGGLLSIFPLRGLTSDGWQEFPWYIKILDYFWHLFLPLFCSVLGSFAFVTLLMKNSVLEEIEKQYVLLAKSKGLTTKRVLWRHIVPNASIPIVTGFPSQFLLAFFSGNLLIEIIFSLDGLGLLGYDSAINRDYPVLLALLYSFACITLVAKLLTDIMYRLVDPRITFFKDME